MCDTLYAGSPFSRDGTSWFAKNSDRDPNEPQGLFLIDRRGSGGQGPDLGYAFALSKPSWMAGGEAGLNEKGVAIGNEAVFSRWKSRPDGVLGMDILRAALTASDTARSAASFISAFVESHDQGGNGAFKGKLHYDNSYIVADGREAFIVETAGRRWARKRIVEAATISNAYGVTDDWEELDPVTASELAAGNDRGNWTDRVENRFYPIMTQGKRRRVLTRLALESRRGTLSLDGALSALRSHGRSLPSRRGSLAAPCVHEGGFPVNNATTASIAVSWSKSGEATVLWFSGSSYPCISLFKPILLMDGAFVPLWTKYDHHEDSPSAYGHWRRQLAWIRRKGAGRFSGSAAFIDRRDGAQLELEKLVAEAEKPGALEGEGLSRLRAATDKVVDEWQDGNAGF